MLLDLRARKAYCKHILRCQIPHLLLNFLFTLLAVCRTASAQETTLEGVANALSQQLGRTKEKHFSPKILVIDIPLQSVGINSLSEYLAGQLSDALTQKLSPNLVVDRSRLHDYIQTKAISPLDLADRDAAVWVAGQIGASAIVFGTLNPSGDKLRLSVDLIRLENGNRLGSSKADLPMTDQLRQVASTPLAWPNSPDVVMACRAGIGETALDSFRAAGLTMPTCIHCSYPTYTDEARRAKVQGNVKFDVVVDEQGKPKHISVIRGDTHGLTAKALEAIQKWQFKPSMKDGKPVAVCVVVDIGFRLLY